MENNNFTNAQKERKKSPWCYFKRSCNGSAGICNVSDCGKSIKTVGGSTSGMHNHLKTQHNMNLLKREQVAKIPDSLQIANCSRNITTYFCKTVDDSLSTVIARLTAKDGIPFSKFCTSYDLRKLLKANGYNEIPKLPNSIRKIIF